MQQQSTSLWDATSPSPQFPSLDGDLHVDVAIVGAGITGITAALLLAEKGKRVAVIEKETVGSGETGNTTAHITVAIDARYHYVKRHYSREEAKLVADASRASLEKIAELVQRYGIDCHFKRVPGYLYTEKRKYVAELKSEAAAAREAGLDAQYVNDVPLPFDTRGAVLWPDQARFHPREYLAALARHAAAAGVQIFEHSFATMVDSGVVETERGKVTADAVFMATHVPIAGFTHVHLKSAAYRTYAIGYSNNGGSTHEGLFWDTADPYHYTRWQETDAGTFLIVGGEDHRVGEEEDTEGSFARLREYTRESFGVRPERFRWSGQIIEPHGGLPLIGGAKDVYISTGYSGQGMTFGTAGAMLVSDLILGMSNPWADVFDPMRNRPHVTTKEFITENMHFPAHLLSDRLTAAGVEAKSMEEVGNGEGKIVKVDGKKVAAYRDDQGALHCLSPICTHMKCDVAWNSAERTWDCPCHGSRFTPTGDVLNGPAHEPLEKLD